tara:strand:+ start:185 stop:1570 length:1386 start_codon:yes stop_codon:yes gene_type:complete
MIKYYYIILLFLIASASVSGQQNFTIESNYILFEDAATGEPVLKYNDSMLVRGFKLDTHIKSSFPKDIKASNFSDYHYQINDKNYFVSNGGGLVLELKENNFKRIDNSFRHKNQFRANHFAHNNALYLWGGYGLFTHKNILTFYDFNSKEWLLEEIKIPETLKPRANALHMVFNDNLYIIGGFRSKNNITNIKEPRIRADEFVWRLNLKTFEWHKEKKHTPIQTLQNIEPSKRKHFQIDQKLIIFGLNIEEIDLINDTKKTYQNKSQVRVRNIIYHSKNQYITYIYESDGELKIKSEPLDNLLGELIKKESFYKEEIHQIILKLLLILSIICLFGFLFNKYKSNKKKLKKQIIYKSKDDLFFTINNAPIKLSKMPFNILKLFVKNQNQYISFAVLNEVINEGIGEQNYITLNKRRERVIYELVTELSNKLKIEKKSIIKTRKNEIDKRIKEVKLNIEINFK